MRIFIIFLYSMLLVSARADAQQDTDMVRRYDGIPVFYHCSPLHHYTTLRQMKRTALVSYSSQAFERYARVARKRASGNIGIIIDDLNFGTDSFSIIQFAAGDTGINAAVFGTPIFMSARPTRPYKVIRVLNDQMGSGSLNATLQHYFEEAGTLHLRYDGIMVRDVNYIFRRDQIYVHRWKHPVKPVSPSKTTPVLSQNQCE